MKLIELLAQATTSDKYSNIQGWHIVQHPSTKRVIAFADRPNYHIEGGFWSPDVIHASYKLILNEVSEVMEDAETAIITPQQLDCYRKDQAEKKESLRRQVIGQNGNDATAYDNQLTLKDILLNLYRSGSERLPAESGFFYQSADHVVYFDQFKGGHLKDPNYIKIGAFPMAKDAKTAYLPIEEIESELSITATIDENLLNVFLSGHWLNAKTRMNGIGRDDPIDLLMKDKTIQTAIPYHLVDLSDPNISMYRFNRGARNDGIVVGKMLQTSSGFIINESINERATLEPVKKNKYLKSFNGIELDVYDVIDIWQVNNPALQHLIKKALQAGDRGHKDLLTDMQDIIDSAIRAKQIAERHLEKEKRLFLSAKQA